MELDIYCKKLSCPICEQKINKMKIEDIICFNDCYKIIFLNDITIIYIFKVPHIINNDKYRKEDRDRQEMQVKNSIRYWKKNEKYILKILE